MDITVEFTTISCNYCGFIFAVPEKVRKTWRGSHSSFYCPSCKGSMYYPSESDEEKLKKQVNRLQGMYREKLSCCTQLQEEVSHKDRRINGYKGALAKEKKRAKANDRPHD